MWSPEEDHIWGALDEGCNSTCHSKAWGELAEDRLRAFDLTFPWIDSSTKSFAGLGSSTKTLGKRNLPFCIQVGEDSLAGAMESHEVDTEAFNPLLVSLFAQAKLGLIKDMAQCRCYIGDLEVPMARCTHTGLLLLCLSQFTRRSKLPRTSGRKPTCTLSWDTCRHDACAKQLAHQWIYLGLQWPNCRSGPCLA